MNAQATIEKKHNDATPPRGIKLHDRGTQAAVRYLEHKDYEILDQSWECPDGIIDIVALDDGVLCFIEVKINCDKKNGFPSEAVTAQKRARMESIAASYLMEHEYTDIVVRFDIISLVVLDDKRAFLRFHVNAFGK